MAKNNNKGFSLIEVVIAIALFSLLLSPIIRQFTQTLQTSRVAKEQQYVNDNAEELLEYFQKVDLNRVGADDLGIVDLTSGTRNKKNVTCEILDTSGNLIGSVTYNLSVYKPENVKLGTQKTDYKRTVYVDDLVYKLAAFDSNPADTNPEGYKIKYDCDSTLAASFSDFKLANNNSLVKYNADDEVVSVVCEKVDYSVLDPNQQNLGNMQNLDYNTVALIQGYATNFDKQADDAFYSLKMQNLKTYNNSSWDQAMKQVDGWNIFENINLASTTNKLTLVKVRKNTNGNSDPSDDTFTITADVFYEDNYNMPKDAESGGGTISLSDKLQYNVFSQTFNMSECPNVYFTYQPYTIYRGYDATGKRLINFASKDYILVDSDVDDLKIYLIKPTTDERVASNTGTNNNAGYVTNNLSADLVDININYAVGSKMPTIFTNLDVTGMTNTGNRQFVLSAYNNVASAGYPSLRDAFNKSNIKSIVDDTREGEVVARVTVKYEKSDGTGSVVKLTGARGAN